MWIYSYGYVASVPRSMQRVSKKINLSDMIGPRILIGPQVGS
jgi:hypothetical protein